MHVHTEVRFTGPLYRTSFCTAMTYEVKNGMKITSSRDGSVKNDPGNTGGLCERALTQSFRQLG